MLLEVWDRSTLDDQQQTIGRVKDSGAPLGRRAEHDAVDLDARSRGEPRSAPSGVRQAAGVTNIRSASRIGIVRSPLAVTRSPASERAFQ